MINIQDFNSRILKMDKKSYKSIGIYNIGYITIKKIDVYENISSVNSLYLIIGDVGGFIEESNGKKYLTFVSTDNNKKVLEKYTKLWDGIKNSIEKINSKPGEYEKDFMKIKVSSDVSSPLNKILKLHMLTVIVRSVFEEEDGKYYPQFFLDECLYEV